MSLSLDKTSRQHRLRARASRLWLQFKSQRPGWLWMCKPGAQSYSRSDTLVLSHVRWTHISTIIVAIASSWNTLTYCTPIITCTPRNTPWSLQAATVPSEPYRRRAFRMAPNSDSPRVGRCSGWYRTSSSRPMPSEKLTNLV